MRSESSSTPGASKTATRISITSGIGSSAAVRPSSRACWTVAPVRVRARNRCFAPGPARSTRPRFCSRRASRSSCRRFFCSVGDADALTLVGGITVALLPSSVVSFALVHWAITLWIGPTALPKLDFRKGIADDCRSVVAVPALVADERDVPVLLEKLETHYLANSDPSLEFALLTDGVDAPSEQMPNDAAILAALRSGIGSLNTRYGREGLRAVSPAPPTAEVQSPRELLDGLGAQAWKARRAERSARGRIGRRILGARR